MAQKSAHDAFLEWEGRGDRTMYTREDCFKAGWEACERAVVEGGACEVVVKPEPPLTREQVLYWPNSEEGLRKLREECAKIAGIKLLDETPGYFVLVPSLATHMFPSRWQPDKDPAQCWNVGEAMRLKGFRLNVVAMPMRGGLAIWYKNLPGGTVHVEDDEELLGRCLAAVLAERGL